MRKRLQTNSNQAPVKSAWLNIEDIAEVVISSEHPEQPVEGALLEGGAGGWRAEESGLQTIRLVFDQPQKLQRIYLEFSEPVDVRTQEYVLRWSSDCGGSFQEIVRQQWNFSPDGSTEEAESHRVDLSEVTEPELSILPDIGGATSFASLKTLRLA
jgi:hypothetical protein